MFSCTNALAQTIEALRKQDWHHPNTPGITQTIQALNKQSVPHIHPSFPRRRESIIMRHLATQNGSPPSRGCRAQGMFSCTNALAQTIGALRKQDWHHPNTPDITQTIQALNKQSFPHINLSFPQRRESIAMRHIATQNGSPPSRGWRAQGMFSCTNALAQTIGALRKQDSHHPSTPDITQTIQALNKQSFPHIHLSFPRRRESIVGSAIFWVIDRNDCVWESFFRLSF